MMKVPSDYENMIREIAGTARKYGFLFRKDTLTDIIPLVPGTGHEFEVCVSLFRQNDDFIEDAAISL